MSILGILPSCRRPGPSYPKNLQVILYSVLVGLVHENMLLASGLNISVL